MTVQVFEEPVSRPPCDDGLSPRQHGQSGGRMEGAKASELSTTRTEVSVSLPCPKLCSRLYPRVFKTLNVSFSIFQHARPQAASSATVAAVTGRSVMKLLQYVRLLLAFSISIENQVTASASSVARNGTAESQR